MVFTTPFKRLFLGTALALGLATSAHAADLQPLRVANQKSTIKTLLEVSGEAKDVPYAIQWSEFPSASPLGEALNAGAVDVGALGDAPYVFALGAGASLKVVSIIHAEGRNTTALLVPKDSPIKTAADLKGKKIVTGRGSIGHYLAIKALASAGLTSQDVQFIFLLPAESRLVLDNGTADAWATWDPYTTVVTSQSQARIIASGNTLLSNHLYLAATGLPLAVHVAVAKETRLSPVLIDDSVISGLQTTADTYQKEGLLTKHIDVSQGFDKSFNAKRAPNNQVSR